MRSLSAAAATCAALCAAGCATMSHGTTQSVRVTSDPPGAQVTVLSQKPGETATVRSHPGVTPLVLELTRRDPNIVVRLEAPGCDAAEIRLKRSVSGWTAGNLIVAN